MEWNVEKILWIYSFQEGKDQIFCRSISTIDLTSDGEGWYFIDTRIKFLLFLNIFNYSFLFDLKKTSYLLFRKLMDYG